MAVVLSDRERKITAEIMQMYFYEAKRNKSLTREEVKILTENVVMRVKRRTGKTLGKKQLQACWAEFYPDPEAAWEHKHELSQYDPGSGYLRHEIKGTDIRERLCSSTVSSTLSRYQRFDALELSENELPAGIRFLKPVSEIVPKELHSLWQILVKNSGDTLSLADKYTAVNYLRYSGYRPIDFNGLNAPVSITFLAPSRKSFVRIELPLIQAIPESIRLDHIYPVIREYHRQIAYIPALLTSGGHECSVAWFLPGENQQTGILMNLSDSGVVAAVCMMFNLLLNSAVETVRHGSTDH